MATGRGCEQRALDGAHRDNNSNFRRVSSSASRDATADGVRDLLEEAFEQVTRMREGGERETV